LSSPWNDAENLFTPGKDFKYVQNKAEMKEWMLRVIEGGEEIEQMKEHGLQTIQQRHTCANRVDELYNICEEIGVNNLTQTTA
jgi:spore maturation protein CgeB